MLKNMYNIKELMNLLIWFIIFHTIYLHFGLQCQKLKINSELNSFIEKKKKKKEKVSRSKENR